MADDYSYPEEKFILLGKIAKAHGLKGEVKIYPFSGHPENIAGYEELVLVDRAGLLSPSLAVLQSRVQGKMAIVRLASIGNRNGAEAVEGRGVLLAKEHLPAAEKDEYYWHQYQGRRVVETSGKHLGTVKALFNNGAQDVLVVEADGDEILIPVTKEIVVDDRDDQLIIDPPPGLLGLSGETEV